MGSEAAATTRASGQNHHANSLRPSLAQKPTKARKIGPLKRGGSESNRRYMDLQSIALPLGYLPEGTGNLFDGSGASQAFYSRLAPALIRPP